MDVWTRLFFMSNRSPVWELSVILVLLNVQKVFNIQKLFFIPKLFVVLKMFVFKKILDSNLIWSKDLPFTHTPSNFLFQTLTVTAFPTTEVDQVPSRHEVSSKCNFNYLFTCAASSELLTFQGKPSVLSKLNNIWQMPYLFIYGLHWTNLVMITDRFLIFHLL